MDYNRLLIYMLVFHSDFKFEFYSPAHNLMYAITSKRMACDFKFEFYSPAHNLMYARCHNLQTHGVLSTQLWRIYHAHNHVYGGSCGIDISHGWWTRNRNLLAGEMMHTADHQSRCQNPFPNTVFKGAFIIL